MSERLRGTDMIIAGDLNVDLERTVRRFLYKDILEVVATAGLKDLSGHFLPRWRP